VSIEERHRIALHEAARESWGPDVAGTLMEMLPPGGWAEVATKSDIAASSAAVRADLAIMRSDLSAQRRELRAEIASQGKQLRSELAAQGTELRTQIMLLGDRLGSRIDANGQQLRIDLAESQVRMLKWMVTTILGCSTVIVAASALIR